MTDDKAHRLRLAEELSANGHLRTAPWRAAVEAVPRHEFLRGGFFDRVDTGGPTRWRPVMPDADQWMRRCYSDESLVTQIAGTIVPRDIHGAIPRAPTSSGTLPGLVVRMLEDLQVEDGHRLLEIGTGTGYSTALACHRLGDDAVTSVEVDPDVSGAACGVLGIPSAWIEQARPGGIVLATLSGWLYSSELARLTVTGDGTAHGRFLGGGVSFMLARGPHRASADRRGPRGMGTPLPGRPYVARPAGRLRTALGRRRIACHPVESGWCPAAGALRHQRHGHAAEHYLAVCLRGRCFTRVRQSVPMSGESPRCGCAGAGRRGLVRQRAVVAVAVEVSVDHVTGRPVGADGAGESDVVRGLAEHVVQVVHDLDGTGGGLGGVQTAATSWATSALGPRCCCSWAGGRQGDRPTAVMKRMGYLGS